MMNLKELTELKALLTAYMSDQQKLKLPVAVAQILPVVEMSAADMRDLEETERQREEYETIGMRPDGSFPAGHFAARRAAEKDRYFSQHDTREEARA